MASAISKVKQKLKQVKFRHLKAYLSENLRADPRNCTHNEIRKSNSGVVHTCGYEGADTFGKICDVSFGKDRSLECGLFCPKKSKEDLKSEFYNFIDSSSIGEVAKEFPDVTALMWVLDTLGADETDIGLKDHYEKIENLTVENHTLKETVEDLRNMLQLQTTEVARLESEKRGLALIIEEERGSADQLNAKTENIIEEKNQLLKDKESWENERLVLEGEINSLRGLIDQKDHALSIEINKTLWQRFMGFFR